MLDNDSDSSSGGGSGAASGLAGLPFTVIGVLAFVNKAAVLSAAESLFGAGVVAVAAAEAMWVVGLVTVSFLVILAAAGVLGFLKGVATQDSSTAVISGLVCVAYGLAYYIGQTFFSSLPMLVAFALGASLLVYAVVILFLGIGILVFLFAG